MLPNHNYKDGSQSEQAGCDPFGFNLCILKVVYKLDVWPI
jgi:hypothetical protein